MYAMTAAHPTLPIPSYARVRNPANGREVLVRVNDRGPFVAGRIVDLSYAAALKLDLLRGVAPVELERITFEEIRTGAWRGASPRLAALAPRAAPAVAATTTAAVDVPAQDVAFAVAPMTLAPSPPPSAAPAPGLAPTPIEASRGFWVQLGAFRERDGAESFRRRVGADGESAWLEPLPRDLRRRVALPRPGRAVCEPRRGRGRGAACARRAGRRADRRRAAVSFSPRDAIVPRQTIVFTGHMVDAPGRATPRFPAARVDAAARRIDAALAALDAGREDLAFTQGAAGGDLLFAEACLARGVPLRLLLPLAEAEFVAASILPVVDGAAWHARYRAVVAALAEPPREAPTDLGPLPAGDDPFVRANLWLLDSALAFGAERLRCICLWDGGGGDGPGGTRHLVEAVRAAGGRIIRIDTNAL